jgi:hypothetical protein
MADSVMTAGSEMSAIVPEVWSAAFFPTLLEKLPFNDSVGRDYEGDIRQLGDIINITDIPQFSSAVEILENERADADAVTLNNTQLTINKQIVKDYIVTKKALTQSLDAQQKLRDLAFHAIMKKMQQVIIADISPSASAPDHVIAYDSGTTLALADLLEAKELLDTADVEEEGRCFITGAAQWNDLFNISGFTSRDYIPAGSPTTTGAFTTPILGMEPKWTSEAGTTTYVFHPMFLQLAVQQDPQVSVFDLGTDGKRASRVNTDCLMGVKQVSNLRVVTIG